MNMNYFLVNSKGMALSQFVGNDLTLNAKQLYFRKNDWYAYSTAKEAEKHKSYILQECNEKVKRAALKLTVSNECAQHNRYDKTNVL